MSDLTLMKSSTVFFERLPFMSVELLGLLENFSAIFYNDDLAFRLLRGQGYPVTTYGNRRLTEAIDGYWALEQMLTNTDFLNSAIPVLKSARSLFFFVNDRIDNLSRAAGLVPAAPPYEMQLKLGSKLVLPSLCQSIGLPIKKTVVIRGTGSDPLDALRRCRDVLEFPFIVQGAAGSSGDDTFLVSSDTEFVESYRKLGGELRAAAYLVDIIPISTHICITQSAILFSGPFLQIVGFAELSSKPFQFCGNDTNQSMFGSEFKIAAAQMSMRVAEFLRDHGYRGILGLDFLWDRSRSVLYLQELNTRLVALTRLLTGIEREQKIVPTLVRHICEFAGDIELLSETFTWADAAWENGRYSQPMLHNNTGESVEITNALIPGVYRVSEDRLVPTKQSMLVKDMDEDEVLITQSANIGSKVGPGGPIARAILKRSVFSNGQYSLNSLATNLFACIRRQMTSASPNTLA